MSISLQSKPVPHKTIQDWLCGVWELRQSGQTARADSFELRQEARTLRNETKIRTEYDKFHNEMRLGDRISEVGRWREILRRAQACIELEQKALDEEKANCEELLERISANMGVVAECLSLLDKRQANDIVCDDAWTELRNEQSCFEAQQALLTDRCHSAFDEHNRLDDISCMLGRTIHDQEVAMDLDSENLTQTRHSGNITFKPYPFEEPPNTISHEAWLEHVRCSKMRADNEVASAVKLREAMAISRARADNEMKTQKNLAEFALRKIAYETQRCKNELEWQKHKLKEAMEKLRGEILALDHAMKDKDSAQMLAETRLETRKYRPNCEFVKDEPMAGLAEEVRQVERTRRELHEKLKHSKATYNAMEDLLVVIDQDLEGKVHALTALIQAIDTHKRIGPACEIPPNPSTARNLKLTHYDKEITPCAGPFESIPHYEKVYEPEFRKCGIKQDLLC